MSVLEVQNVSIRYLTGDFKDIGLKEYFMRKWTGNYRVKEFWADWNVSFTLEKGDMLGIIGANGAGKSTLLKVVSGIMEPTRGWVKREGEIAALLELGSGFDGDLTVRENTYLRGAMMGYTRKYMDETYDQIVAFAELKGFEDRPFKQLSSGMKSRLAFSIASLVRPDILIIDEVLSVGDGAFRKKSEAKMQEIIGSGATTILVSHSIEQVQAMCNKVLWLDKGKQIAYGSNVEEICEQYRSFLCGDTTRIEAYAQAYGGPPEAVIHVNKAIPQKRLTAGALTVLSLSLVCVLAFNAWKSVNAPPEGLESPLEYVWQSTEGNVILSENSAELDYEGTPEKIYFHLFDMTTSGPVEYKELACVPDGVQVIQFGCTMHLKRGLLITAYLQQFDAEGKRIEEVTKIETIDTTSFRADGSSYGQMSYSIRENRHVDCKTFSVLFDVRPRGEGGTVTLSNIDIVLQ